MASCTRRSNEAAQPRPTKGAQRRLTDRRAFQETARTSSANTVATAGHHHVCACIKADRASAVGQRRSDYAFRNGAVDADPAHMRAACARVTALAARRDATAAANARDAAGAARAAPRDTACGAAAAVCKAHTAAAEAADTAIAGGSRSSKRAFRAAAAAAVAWSSAVCSAAREHVCAGEPPGKHVNAIAAAAVMQLLQLVD